jgi:hypothetical protein
MVSQKWDRKAKSPEVLNEITQSIVEPLASARIDSAIRKYLHEFHQ